ncbi:T9SS type A sorting domain-containing protein [Hymenobacter rubidus]|uniref:T9SS type A sorting domain-containing protein n=1 Tax=Hymenobacter rubidus TaxID=1441626 RepID=UPI00191FE0C8|nr:T9SS type A sorting domain-containing protein [Hymenobacter rubidus]
MTTLFRTCRRLLLPMLLLAAGAAAAQDVLPRPLSADPGRAVYDPAENPQVQRRGTTALALPFFDDFTTPLEGAPKAQNWQPKGGALVNNRMAIQPLTRGTATLDGLKANGQNYSGVPTVQYGVIDSLWSQPINLAGLSPSDNVYLSFAWQAGSIASVPSSSFGITTVRLALMVKTNTGIWEQAWVYNSQGRRTPFRQQVIDLNQAKYLHGDFQFMLVASGNRSDNNDNWGVDYVYLNRGRSMTDTTYTDYATAAGLRGGNPSGGLRSPLRRFTAMPIWQFNASPVSELNPRLGVNISNLRSGNLPTLINFQGTVREVPAGPQLGMWFQRLVGVPTAPRLDSVTGHANSLAIATSTTPRTLRYTLALNTNETNPLTLSNDTIFRDVELNNYYAYDDGTVEGFLNILPYTSGQQAGYAYRFDLNQADHVGGLRLYPVYPGTDGTGSGTGAFDYAARTVTISVWDDANGQPAATPRASKVATIPAATASTTRGQSYQINFDQPVPVSGTFYVGFSQPPTNRILPYGFDFNSTYPTGYLMSRSNTGTWSAVNYTTGALMMRPVMTNMVTTATTPAAREAAAYRIYPNPTRGSVTVEGPAFARAAVVDAVGRTVWEQPAAQAGQAALLLPVLPAGLYTVRLTLPDGRTASRRLAIE